MLNINEHDNFRIPKYNHWESINIIGKKTVKERQETRQLGVGHKDLNFSWVHFILLFGFIIKGVSHENMIT